MYPLIFLSNTPHITTSHTPCISTSPTPNSSFLSYSALQSRRGKNGESGVGRFEVHGVWEVVICAVWFNRMRHYHPQTSFTVNFASISFNPHPPIHSLIHLPRCIPSKVNHLQVIPPLTHLQASLLHSLSLQCVLLNLTASPPQRSFAQLWPSLFPFRKSPQAQTPLRRSSPFKNPEFELELFDKPFKWLWQY